MNSAQAQSSRGSPIRRRRLITFGAILLGLIVFIFYVPWELPASVKDTGISGLSRANVAQLAGKPKVQVDEIYGLLHLVTTSNQRMLSSDPHLDPTKPIDWEVYATAAKIDWEKEMKRLNKELPIVVFSKSYCPYSRRAKVLLQNYDIQPPPRVIEVDMRDDDMVIKQLLTRLTNHSTFPNIIFQGKSIGGSDNLLALHSQNELVKLIEGAGAVARRDGSDPA